MEKRGYLAIFILVIIGLMMGFSIATQFTANNPWHPVQQVTNAAGTNSIDANNNDRVDRADSIGENVYSAWNLIFAAGPGAAMPNPLPPIAYNTWAFIPGGIVVPATAEHLIISYTVTTTGNAVGQCQGIILEFTGEVNAINAPLNRILSYSIGDFSPYATTQSGQLVVPIRKDANGVNQQNLYFRFLYFGPGGRILANPNYAQPCTYALYYNGYIE